MELLWYHRPNATSQIIAVGANQHHRWLFSVLHKCQLSSHPLHAISVMPHVSYIHNLFDVCRLLRLVLRPLLARKSPPTFCQYVPILFITSHR
jgi:hypothetical protein